jgi:hypothetical protein
MDGRKLRPEDLQGRVLICLESPGSIYLDREIARRSLEIVQGPVNDPEDLDALDYSTVTILRDDVNRFWPLEDSSTKARNSGNKVRRRPPPPSVAAITEMARNLREKEGYGESSLMPLRNSITGLLTARNFMSGW